MTTTAADLEREGKLSHMRQRDWFDPTAHPNSEAFLFGCGGVGSFVAFGLAKLGISRFTLIDFDTVEPHNIPNQMFTMDDTGKFKVDAVRNTIEAVNGFANVVSYNAKLTDEGEWQAVFDDVPEGIPPRPSGILICAPDTMKARENIWQQARLNLNVPLMLDYRLGGTTIVQYAFDPRDPDDIDGYERTLHSDAQARETVCTRQSIIDVAMQVTSQACRAVRKHFADEPVEKVMQIDQERNIIMKGTWS